MVESPSGSWKDVEQTDVILLTDIVLNDSYLRYYVIFSSLTVYAT